MLNKPLVGVRTEQGLPKLLGELKLNLRQESISSWIFSSTQAYLLILAIFYCSLEMSDSSFYQRTFLMSSLRLCLFEKAFSLDQDCIFWVLRVSLKSLMVMRELEADTIFWLSLSFLFLSMLSHHLWMIMAFPMMYFASSIYFLVIYPLATFWIFMAACSRLESSFNSMLLLPYLVQTWQPSVFTDFKSGQGRQYLSLEMNADSQGCSLLNYWKLTQEYRMDLCTIASILFQLGFGILQGRALSLFISLPWTFLVAAFTVLFDLSSYLMTECVFELISVLMDPLLRVDLSPCQNLEGSTCLLPDFFRKGSCLLRSVFLPFSDRLVVFLVFLALSS